MQGTGTLVRHYLERAIIEAGAGVVPTPLAEVDLSTAEERGQGNLFENDCTGYCGV